MARARQIKPGFFTDGDLACLPPCARILYIGLWCLADREGRLRDRPRDIKLRVLPADDVDVDRTLDDLSPRFITRYVAAGERYIQVNGFLRHQSPHRGENSGGYPPPEAGHVWVRDEQGAETADASDGQGADIGFASGGQGAQSAKTGDALGGQGADVGFAMGKQRAGTEDALGVQGDGIGPAPGLQGALFEEFYHDNVEDTGLHPRGVARETDAALGRELDKYISPPYPPCGEEEVCEGAGPEGGGKAGEAGGLRGASTAGPPAGHSVEERWRAFKRRAAAGRLVEKEALIHAGFCKFWEAYPKKRSEAEALRAYWEIAPGEALQREILRAVAANKRSWQWQKKGGQFVPHAAKWLRGACWRDEVREMDADRLGFAGFSGGAAPMGRAVLPERDLLRLVSAAQGSPRPAGPLTGAGVKAGAGPAEGAAKQEKRRDGA